MSYLDATNFSSFIEAKNHSIVFINDDENPDYSFATFGIKHNRDYYEFAYTHKTVAPEYKCSVFPCIIPFHFGKRIGIDKAPNTPVSFAHWLKSLRSGYIQHVETAEELRLLFDATRSLIFSVYDKEPQYLNRTDGTIYYTPISNWLNFKIKFDCNNEGPGLYCYNPIFKTMDKTDEEHIPNCYNQSVIHPKGVKLTERKFLAGYFTDPYNTSMNEKIIENIKTLSSDADLKDFWFTIAQTGRQNQYLADAGQFAKGVPPFFFVLNTSDLKYTKNRWCLSKEDQKFDINFIKAFLINISENKQPYSLLSEPIPTKRDQYQPNLIRAVTDNINDILFEPGKDVFLTVTASWCMHCHEFIPTLNQIANLLVGKVEVVYIDGDLNELPSTIPDFSGYPAMFFYHGINKTGIRMEIHRDIDSILEYLGTNSSKPFDPTNLSPDSYNENYDQL